MAQRCDGYSKVAPRAGYKGTPPDWTRLAIIDLFPALKDVIKMLKDIIDSLISGTTKFSSAIIDFINLLESKIDYLQSFINQIQSILDIISQDFKGTGFYLLNVPYAPGGNKYLIDTIQGANNGPKSDAFGYTGGIAIVYGGPEGEAIGKALDILF